MMTRFILSLLLALPLAVMAQQLDPSFGGDGISPLVSPVPELDARTWISELEADTKDRAVFATTSRVGSARITYLGRILPNGLPDPDFGGGGLLRLIVPGMSAEIVRISPLEDERILTVGRATDPSGTESGLLVRLLPSGSTDPAQGGGVWTYDVRQITDVAVVSEDRYALLVHLNAPSAARCGVLLVDSDGTPVGTFGTDGLVELPQVTACRPVGLIASGGAIYASGTAGSGFDQDVFIARIGLDGILDPSFGDAGIVTRGFFGIQDFASDLSAGPDGDILLTGTTWKGDRIGLFILRLDPDGTPDEFGDAGVVFASDSETSFSGYLEGVGPFGDILSDGRVVVASSAYTGSTSTPSLAIHRFQRDGNLDPSFGASGVFLYTRGTQQGTQGQGLAIDSQQRLLFGGNIEKTPGSFATTTFVGRLSADPSTTDAFSLNFKAVSTTDVPAEGGGIRFRAKVTNDGPDAAAPDLWAIVTKPDGGTLFAVRPRPRALASGGIYAKRYRLQLPSIAPAGEYSLTYSVGDYPDAVASETITFTKATAAAGGTPVPGDELKLIEEGDEATPLAISPNPTRGVSHVTPEAAGVVTMHDALGREVFHANARGGERLALPTDRLPAGVYTVSIQGENERQTARLTVVR